MIIKNIQLVCDAKFATLSADCKIRKIGWNKIYFKVSANHYELLCADASPFAAALLLPSMKLGEDLIIHGSISEQLYRGMHAIMSEILTWNIGLKPIDVKADILTPDTYAPDKVGTFFSGGVDSFYTFLKHKNDKDKSQRVDSLIFINNSFDIDPRNQKLWDQTLQYIETIAGEEHVDLVLVESNINSHELLAPILTWDFLHGACLAATGLLLRKGFRRIYIPSTHSTEQLIPWGSHPALDRYWSTEAITFVHDGSEVNRLGKVITQISQSPTALKHLRVCYKNLNGHYNCGKCDKCMRTMVSLDIAGVLENAGTFPHQLDTELIANTPTISGKDGGIFHTENLEALKQRDMNSELQKAITTSLASARDLKEQTYLDRLRTKLVYLDHAYCGGLIYARLSDVFGKKFI